MCALWEESNGGMVAALPPLLSSERSEGSMSESSDTLLDFDEEELPEALFAPTESPKCFSLALLDHGLLGGIERRLLGLEWAVCCVDGRFMVKKTCLLLCVCVWCYVGSVLKIE